MSAATNIEWCDSTFNPWIGCTKVSPACDHCYAERDMAIRHKRVEWGAGKPRSRTSVGNWKLPERWNKKADGHRNFAECDCGYRGLTIHGGACASCGSYATKQARRRVFCSSLADWLDNEVAIEWLVDLLDLIRRTPNLDWLLLSKRIGNWRGRIAEAIGYLDERTPAEYPLPLRRWLSLWLDGDEAPANVWIGATVVNQAEADRDVPKLLAVPARVRFLSMEPLLGPVDLTRINLGESKVEPVPGGGWDGVKNVRFVIDALKGAKSLRWGQLHWVIPGGETGPHARPMHPDWVRSLRDQCLRVGVPFLFKQWGEWAFGPFDADTPENLRLRAGDSAHVFADGLQMGRVGKKAAGRLLDGRTWDEFPRASA